MSSPSSHLGGVPRTIIINVKKLVVEHAALEYFLQNHVDLDFVSPPLMKFVLKREHPLEEETDRVVTINTTHPVTHEVIVGLDNVCVREKLKDKFTSK